MESQQTRKPKPLGRLPFYAVISVLLYWVPVIPLNVIDPQGYDHAGMGLCVFLPVVFIVGVLACLDCARLFRQHPKPSPESRVVAVVLTVLAISPTVAILAALIR